MRKFIRSTYQNTLSFKLTTNIIVTELKILENIIIIAYSYGVTYYRKSSIPPGAIREKPDW